MKKIIKYLFLLTGEALYSLLAMIFGQGTFRQCDPGQLFSLLKMTWLPML